MFDDNNVKLLIQTCVSRLARRARVQSNMREWIAYAKLHTCSLTLSAHHHKMRFVVLSVDSLLETLLRIKMASHKMRILCVSLPS